MLLELNGLSAHFGKKQVLHQMSLSVGEGEVVALIGPNAAGKSTTMRSRHLTGHAIDFAVLIAGKVTWELK